MDENPLTRDGLIVRSEEPLNLEMPFARLDGLITPNESFYVRCHFPIPQIRASEWRLKVEGTVRDALELDYEELRGMESRTISATLECAGNNRIFLEPKVKGVQWALGAVGNASWTGVPLSALLQRAGVDPDASEVILEGADEGEVDKSPQPTGNISFARSIPLSKAVDDVLLAYQMNGEPLSATHGFPVRAIVPGWYAMASIKWLRRIVLSATPFNGYYQSLDYTYCERRDGFATLTPISEQQIKAEIARPQDGETVPAESVVRVQGAAWSGGAHVTTVQISVDAGVTWHAAQLAGEPVENAWRLWQYDGRTPAARGRQTIMARATDSRGRSQPFDRDPDRGSYMINHILPIEVEVV